MSEVPASAAPSGSPTPSRAAWAISVASALAALALLAPRLTALRAPYWDEGFYLTDARRLFRADGLLNNPEHPPLGKWLLGLGVQLAGDDALGWRLAPLVATVLLLAVLPLALERTGIVGERAPRWVLALPSVLLLIDPLVYTTGRIATLDALLDLFYVASALAFLVSLRSGAAPREADAARLLASVLAGLALGTKWTALTLLPVFAVACVRVDGKHFRIEPRRVWQLFGPLVVAYVACFALPGATRFGPHAFPVSDGPLDPDASFPVRFVTLQWRMVGYHTYYYASEFRSAWYEWLHARQALWYTAQLDGSAIRVVAAVGSPLLWLTGLSAVLACVVVGVRERRALPLAIAAFPVAQLALWAVALRMTMLYYMSDVVPFYALAIAWCAAEALSRRPEARRAIVASLALVTAVSLGWFVYVLPLLRGDPLSERTLHAYARSEAAPFLFHDAFPLERVLEVVHGEGFGAARLED